MSIKLAKKLFESKIQPILTYESIILGVEKSTNTVTLNGLEYDDTLKSIKKFIQTFFSTLWNGYCPELDLVKRFGRKSDKERPIFIKFSHFQDKENLLYCTRNLPQGIQLCDNYKTDSCEEIKQVQDKFLKHCIGVTNNCYNVISRAELGKFPLQLKVHSQMIKYFLRLTHSTANDVINDAFICAKEINSQYFQTVTKLLKSNGFSYVISSPLSVDKHKFDKEFYTGLKDNYIQEFRYSSSSKTSDYGCLYLDLNSYEFQNYLDNITNIDHRKTLIKLRTGNYCLFIEKGRYENIDRRERLCLLCSKEVEDLMHFIFKCEILKDERYRLLSILYDKTGESFKRKPHKEQLHELFTLSFNNDILTAHIGKGIFDMYRKREKSEKQRLGDL